MTSAATPSQPAQQPPCLVVGLDRKGDLTADADLAFTALTKRPSNQSGCVAGIVRSAQFAQLFRSR